MARGHHLCPLTAERTHQKEPPSVVRQTAAGGMAPLNREAPTRVPAGMTTVAEILRAVYMEDAA